MAQLSLRALKFSYQPSIPDLAAIARDLSMCPLLADLTKHGALERLAELVLEKSFGEGEILAAENDLQSSLWILVEGKLSGSTGQGPFSGRAKVAVYDGDSKDTFGASSLLQPDRSTMTMTAETSGRYYVLDGMAYDQFAKEFPESALELQSKIARSLIQQIKKAQESLRLLQTTLNFASNS